MRMEVMFPPVFTTDAIPRRKQKASTGFIFIMNGSMIARVVGPPNPGKIPTTRPIRMPNSINPKAAQEKI
jgi:hypothetical protein